MTGSATFTPQQVLDAGRRAEAEGRRDFAMQFYRHLADHWSDTIEAAAAREGLARLGQPVPVSIPAYVAAPPPQTHYANGTTMPPRAATIDRVPAPSTPATQPPPRAASLSSRDKYRAGRFVAGFIIGLGLLTVLAGTVSLAIAAAKLVGKPILLPEPIPPIEIVPAVAMISGGLVTMFIGQLAQAVFDSANALQRLQRHEQ